jgi:hypothetical protein
VQGHLVGPVLAALRAGMDPVLAARPGGGLVPGLQRGAARPRAGGGEGEDGEVAADAGSDRACTRRWGSTRTTYVHRRWGSRLLAVVGTRHPRPPARHWAAERRHPSPRPAARARARPRCCWVLAGPRRGRMHVVCGARPWGHIRRQSCERRAAGWRVPAEPTMLRLNSHVHPCLAKKREDCLSA